MGGSKSRKAGRSANADLKGIGKALSELRSVYRFEKKEAKVFITGFRGCVRLGGARGALAW